MKYCLSGEIYLKKWPGDENEIYRPEAKQNKSKDKTNEQKSTKRERAENEKTYFPFQSLSSSSDP